MDFSQWEKWFDKVAKCDCCGKFAKRHETWTELIDLNDGGAAYAPTLCQACHAKWQERQAQESEG
jgi:hypothetical protein